jgi:hypothetical protein
VERKFSQQGQPTSTAAAAATAIDVIRCRGFCEARACSCIITDTVVIVNIIVRRKQAFSCFDIVR